jgi:hypothetical protein
LRPLGEAESQGPHERFVLYEISWLADDLSAEVR